MEKICNDCRRTFKYQAQDIITEKDGIPCIIIKCPKCNTFNVLDIDFPSGISKKVVGVRPKGLILSGKAKI